VFGWHPYDTTFGAALNKKRRACTSRTLLIRSIQMANSIGVSKTTTKIIRLFTSKNAYQMPGISRAVRVI
jgi:hypothetical protein